MLICRVIHMLPPSDTCPLFPLFFSYMISSFYWAAWLWAAMLHCAALIFFASAFPSVVRSVRGETLFCCPCVRLHGAASDRPSRGGRGQAVALLPRSDTRSTPSVSGVPVNSVEARCRRRDIRWGKRPVEDNPFKKCVSLPSAVCAPSPVAVQRDCPTLPFSPFRSASFQQPVHPSLTSGPSFVSGFRTVTCAYPTPLVFPLPYVHPLQAGFNRRKRKFIWKHRSGKIKIKKIAPPFPKDHINLLKATIRGRSYYGGPDYICGSCNALYWFQERSKGAHDGRLNLPVYNGCCCAGKVSLPKFPDWPFPLKDLLRFDEDDASSTFLRLIRHYNSMFCFTSLGAHVDESINMGNGPYIFKMGGSVYHRIGSLVPTDDETPKFAQLYIVD